MAKFESKYKELAFFVDGEALKFHNGTFDTEDKKAIEALTKLPSAKRVEEELPEVEEPKKEAPKKTKAASKKSTKKKAE